MSTLKTNIASLDSIPKKDITRNYLLEEIQQNELMSEKHKKVCRALNYFEDFLIFISAVSGCVSISAFASLTGIPIVITSFGISEKWNPKLLVGPKTQDLGPILWERPRTLKVGPETPDLGPNS